MTVLNALGATNENLGAVLRKKWLIHKTGEQHKALKNNILLKSVMCKTQDDQCKEIIHI